MRVLIPVALLSLLLAACETDVPPPPPVTVVVSPVDYRTALADGVALALTATAQHPVAATETALARLGVSLTPSLTPSPTPTPRPPTPTPQVKPSATPLTSPTPTPTFAPFPVNFTERVGQEAAGRLRVLNAWAESAIDVYLNDVRVSRALPFAGATAYQQLNAGAVRVTVRAGETTLSQVVNVPAGGSVSVLAADFGDDVRLRQVNEDVSALPRGLARLTVLQANFLFLRSNLMLPDLRRALAYDLDLADQAGPVALPSRDYQLEFYDSGAPELLLTNLENLHLDSQVNYLLVLLPPR